MCLPAKEILYEEIEKLPDNLISDVFNYILFLENKNENNRLTVMARTLSEDSFSKIWDNEEDAVYDKL